MAASTAGWLLRLNNHQFCKYLRENNGKDSRLKLSKDVKQLIAVNCGNLFVWDDFSAHFIYFNLKLLLNSSGPSESESNNIGNRRHQTLLCTNAPKYEVEGITFNCSGSHTAVWGQSGICVMELPRRWGKYGEYEGGKSVISCRTISVAERYCIGQNGVKVQQVEWHPGSATDCHIVILTSDNILSVYDLTEPDKAFQTINFDSVHQDLNISPTKMSYSAALGDRAVAFDFGKSIQLKHKKKVLSVETELSDCIMWPVYVVKGNGNVHVAYTNTFSKREINLPVQGPLIMYPQADDNYGVDACDIICLNTVQTMVVIATCGGKLHNCLLLQSTDNDTTLQFNESSQELSESILYQPIDEMVLYVIESVELELSLTRGNIGELIEDDVTCPIKLQKDPSAYDRYHCSHSAGVHTIALPWVQKLNTFVTDDEESNLISPDNQQCIVEHVICTKPLLSSTASPILGLSVVTDPSLGITLLVLTNDYRFAALPLGSKHRTTSIPLASDSLATSVTSPLRKINRQPFDEHIAQLLQRTSSNPLLQSGSRTGVSQQECFQLLCRATQILREEYIQKQDQARIEIETRVRILKEQKINQVDDIQRLQESRNIFQDKAEGLAEKLELCQNTQELILNRLDVVLRKAQSRLPMLSDAEKSFSKELQTIGDNVEKFIKNLEQLKKKQEYQKRRMDPGSNSFTNSPILKGNQMTHLKDILKEESDEISHLIKQVNELKINTNISSS